MFSSMYNIDFYNFFFSLAKTWISNIIVIYNFQYKLIGGRKFDPFSLLYSQYLELYLAHYKHLNDQF